MSFDLTGYRSRFDEICHDKFGRKYDFARLEQKCEMLRNGKRWLVAKDVDLFFDPDQTPLARYWGRPDEKKIDQLLSKSRLFLGPQPKSSSDLLTGLLNVFHNIGQVSIILRFVHPGQYSIFSTPITNLLQVHASDAIHLYLSYCDELRRWQDHFRLNTVADTEMGLWAFDQAIKRAENSSKALQLRKPFDEDLWIQRRRAMLAIRPLLQNNSPLVLAKILVEETPKLAGKLAAEEYERLLKVACTKYYRHNLLQRPGAAEALLDRLACDEHISTNEKVDLRRVWEIRNRVVHPNESPTATEIEWMIDQIESVCLRWGKAKPG
jgi:hypothetical protein